MSSAKEDYYKSLTFPGSRFEEGAFCADFYIHELEQENKKLKEQNGEIITLLRHIQLEKKQGIRMYNDESIEELLKKNG